MIARAQRQPRPRESVFRIFAPSQNPLSAVEPERWHRVDHPEFHAISVKLLQPLQFGIAQIVADIVGEIVRVKSGGIVQVCAA